MKDLKSWLNYLVELRQNDNFLELTHKVENFVAKVLSITLIVVIFVSLIDLFRILSQELFTEPIGFFGTTIIEIFGLFLNVLIALELLENITAYLKKHIVQVELVIVTSIIAVSRKIIIYDSSKYGSNQLLSLGFAIIALSASYWLLKQIRNKEK